MKISCDTCSGTGVVLKATSNRSVCVCNCRACNGKGYNENENNRSHVLDFDEGGRKESEDN